MFRIEVIDENNNVERIELSIGTHKVGRSLWSDIRLKNPSIEKSHAVIEISPDDVLIYRKSDAPIFFKNSPCDEIRNPRSGESFFIGSYRFNVLYNPFSSEETVVLYVPSENEIADGNSSAINEESENVVINYPLVIEQPLPDEDQWNELKQKLQLLVMQKLELHKRDQLVNLSDSELRSETRTMALLIIERGDLFIPSNIDKEKLINETISEAVGLGALEPLLAEDDISEIMVNGPSQVYIERKGRLELSHARFTSNHSLMRIIERIVTPLGRRIDEGSPMVDARLPDGSRVNAIIPPLALKGPTLTIRKFAKERYSMKKMVEFGSLNQEMCEFLQKCILFRKNIIVCGGTGSGKTTFLNALSSFIPSSERIVSIEDAAELQLVQRHVVSLESRPPNVEKQGEVTIRSLVKNALRMRPDRIIVGECRGEEALDMLQAMNTGHDGSLTTAHANSPRDLLSRLEVMVLMAGMDMPVKVIREQISSAVDIIVHQSRFSDGKRRVTSIVEVDGMENDVVLMQTIFEFKQTGISQNGSINGMHRGAGVIPKFYEELENVGIALNQKIFHVGNEPDMRRDQSY